MGAGVLGALSPEEPAGLELVPWVPPEEPTAPKIQLMFTNSVHAAANQAKTLLLNQTVFCVGLRTEYERVKVQGSWTTQGLSQFEYDCGKAVIKMAESKQDETLLRRIRGLDLFACEEKNTIKPVARNTCRSQRNGKVLMIKQGRISYIWKKVTSHIVTHCKESTSKPTCRWSVHLCRTVEIGCYCY